MPTPAPTASAEAHTLHGSVTRLRNLRCSRSPEHAFAADRLQSVCPHDGAPLLAHYDYDRTTMPRERVQSRPFTMWRYRELLPIGADETPVSLGEGGTPLVRASRLESRVGLAAELYVKDEAQNPTGSFKARGMSAAVTVAKRLGARALVAPSAGNAGVALAAYGARASLPVTVFLPRDTPEMLAESCTSYGAHVELVDGLIDDAGKRAAAFASERDAFNVATLREPYRIEGKKTMAYELVEQLGTVPGAIVYPTGGGTGLIGMWKAFDELETLGWIGAERPMMISVQAANCAPIVRAMKDGAAHATRWDDATTAAWGLRVPAVLGDRLILRALHESRGTALAVSEAAMHDGMNELRTSEGIDCGEEGGAAVAALHDLQSRGMLPLDSRPIVLFNTGSALTYGPRT